MSGVNCIHLYWIFDMFLCPPAAAHQEEARWKLLRHQQHRNPHVCGCHHEGGEAAVQRDSHTQVKYLPRTLPPDQHGVSPEACLVAHRSCNGFIFLCIYILIVKLVVTAGFLYSHWFFCLLSWRSVDIFSQPITEEENEREVSVRYYQLTEVSFVCSIFINQVSHIRIYIYVPLFHIIHF